MSYIAHVSSLLRARVCGAEGLVSFGQNISRGSCLGGLTRGIEPGPRGLVLNTPNSENTLVGIGFGLMLKGVDGIFFMKQLDFLLLGLDQLVNSYNIVRRRRSRASFTMMCIVVDSGYEGPQSRLNTLGDFSSMANVPAYTLTNYHDSAAIIERHLVAPGCRIIAASQRLFREEPIRVEGPVQDYQGGAIFRYANGAHATIACFNFAFPQGHELRVAFTKRGQTASLFSVNGTLVSDWSPIVEDVRRTGCLVVLDDSRSTNRLSHQLQLAAVQAIPGVQVVVRERAASDEDLRPHADSFEIDYPQLLGEVVK